MYGPALDPHLVCVVDHPKLIPLLMLPLRALFIGISLNIYKPQVKAKRPRLEHIKYKKISMKMKYLSKKNLIVVLSHLFLSIKHIFQKSG